VGSARDAILVDADERSFIGPDNGLVIYIDHYGNAVSGLRFTGKEGLLVAGGRALSYARTFEEAKKPFWYENSKRLVEIAAPRRSAARLLRLKVGSPVAWQRTV
jgi:S-adenosylmethionine hydrolase